MVTKKLLGLEPLKEQDVAAVEKFIGNIKGYIKDIIINPDLLKKEFGSIIVELDPNATKRESYYHYGYG